MVHITPSATAVLAWAAATAIGLLPIGTATAASVADANSPPTNPNIVVFVADDLGWAGVGYHDGFVKTPNIDRIAHQGVQLDRFCVCPLCSPTRAGLLTGRYPMRFGMGRAVVRPWARYGLPPQEQTLAEALAAAGYPQRAAFGKWHLGHLDPKWHPLNQGFTEFRGCYNGAAAYFDRDRDGQIDWHSDFDDIDEKGYTTDLIADAAAGFVTKHAKDGPFFCYVAFTAPHEPLQAPSEYLDRYAALDDNPADGKPSEKQTMAAMIACMDDGIGRVLKSIGDAGISRDTFIFFLSDNGGIGSIPGNNTPLRGAKLSVYEGGVRVPAAAWWPGVIEGGRTISSPIVNVDVMPTLLHACNAKPAAPVGPLDGVDVFDVLTGKAQKTPDRDLYYFTGHNGLEHEQIAVTTPDGWKLVVVGPDVRRPGGPAAEGHRVELYHLADDPLEKKDLAASQPDRVRALGEKAVAFRQSEPKDYSMPPMNRKPPKFVPPPHWHNGPTTLPAHD